jgi:hypothetical protein
MGDHGVEGFVDLLEAVKMGNVSLSLSRIMNGLFGAKPVKPTVPTTAPVAAPGARVSSPLTTAPAAWSDRFIGRQLAYFSDEFPHWDGVAAYATRVIGDRNGYPTLEAAKAAVAQLLPMPKVVGTPRDWKAYPNAVAYLKNDVGSYAAYELDQPVLTSRGIFRVRTMTAPDYWARDERVVEVDNFQGKVPMRGVREGTLVY